MNVLKFKIHSIVDVITNSSTTIYVYQNSVNEAKNLVNEVLKLMGEENKTADDVFYYGVFCEDDRYLDYLGELNAEELEEIGCPIELKGSYGSDEYKRTSELQTKWFSDIQMKVMKNEISTPSWFSNVEQNNDYWDPDTYLYLIAKDKKFEQLALKIKSLLGSISADGGRDG